MADEAPWSRFTDEQRRAAFLVDRSVLAAAGAGAGKTAVMAVRYVACLLSRHAALTPDRLLALSFTREAAANLRARIERTMRLVLRRGAFPRHVVGEGIVEAQLPPREIEHLRRCLREVPAAPIATVDAMCLQWVTEHASMLGRDPDLRPPEDLAWAQVREQAWGTLVANGIDTPDSDLLLLVEAYGAHNTQAVVQRLGDAVAALPTPTVQAVGGDPVEQVLRRRTTQLEDLATALDGLRREPGKGEVHDRLRRTSGRPSERTALLEWLAQFGDLPARGSEPVKELIRAIWDAVDFPNQRDDKSRTDDRTAFASLSALAAYSASLEDALARRAGAAARLAAAWLRALDDGADRARLAGFASVEAQALQLLGEPAIRRRLGTRYRHVLLDEAQDLNRLQGRLIEALQSAGTTQLFVVGDHRQSIYGFRHAEPEIFSGWEASIDAEGGVSATLAENFRTHPDLLERVRQVFSQDAFAGRFRPEAILAGRTAAEFAHAGTLQCWRVRASRDGQPFRVRHNTTLASELQASQVATVVTASLKAGRKPEHHAILLRNRSRMRLYAQALERAGSPYDTDFPGGLYDAQECHDIEAVLRLAVNHHDRQALAIALGGPWGAADAQDRRLMVEALERTPEQGWVHASTQTPLAELVDGIRSVLADEGVPAAIRRLMRDERLTRRYGRLPLARRRLANLARLAEEELSAGIALDAPGFIARLRERRRLEVDGEEAGGEHLGSRGVRLMTVHQSKGLEWPVVFLPDLHRPFDKRDFSAKALGMVDGNRLQVACQPGDTDGDDTVGLRAGLIADHLRDRQQAEEARLFYVACTRAQEELHALIPDTDLDGPLGDGSVYCPGDWMVGAGITWSDVTIPIDGPVVRAQVTATAAQALPPVVRSPVTETRVVSVTGQLADSLASRRATPLAATGLERATAQALGIAVHAALAQHGPGMSAAVAAAVLAPFATHMSEERQRRLFTNLTNRDLLPGYWSASTRLIEQPVIGEQDGAIVLGVCDVLLQDALGAWHLYDWKTGEAAGSQTSHEQLRCYAQLVAPQLPGSLVSVALVDVEAGTVIPVV
jgi:ATP-dependent helicase/nuclease subunit A